MFPLTNPDLSIAVDHSALQSFPSPIPCRRKMSFDRGASGTTIFHEEIGDWSRYYELASNGEIETYEAAELRKFASVVTAISNVSASIYDYESHNNLHINSRRDSIISHSFLKI